MDMPGRPQLSFANVVSVLALVVALGGGAYAVTLPKNSVGPQQIKKNSVGASELKKAAVRSVDVKDGSLGAADLKAGVIPPTAKITYRRADTPPLPQGAFGRITVGCKPGERIIGGGAGFPFASPQGNYSIYEQLATSGPGILTNPTLHLARPIAEGEVPDVWYASGYQAETNEHTLTVYAICSAP